MKTELGTTVQNFGDGRADFFPNTYRNTFQDPRPTNTPQPTLTPVPTPTPVYYSIPPWVLDPAVNVLLLHTSDVRGRENAVTVFIAQTGERFDIPVAEYVHPTWIEHEDGLYIHIEYLTSYDDPFRSVEELDLITGELKRLEMPRVFTPGVRSISSPDGRYLIRIVEDNNAPTVATLINVETGEEIELTDPFNNEFADGIDVTWSFDGAQA
ncbi:MAG: hypothetical protein KF770_04250 [Anaerolineae bacterium]|nr:hypothetical protein [Anaerolineae bacterium]